MEAIIIRSFMALKEPEIFALVLLEGQRVWK